MNTIDCPCMSAFRDLTEEHKKAIQQLKKANERIAQLTDMSRIVDLGWVKLESFSQLKLGSMVRLPGTYENGLDKTGAIGVVYACDYGGEYSSAAAFRIGDKAPSGIFHIVHPLDGFEVRVEPVMLIELVQYGHQLSQLISKLRYGADGVSYETLERLRKDNAELDKKLETERASLRTALERVDKLGTANVELVQRLQASSDSLISVTEQRDRFLRDKFALKDELESVSAAIRGITEIAEKYDGSQR